MVEKRVTPDTTANEPSNPNNYGDTYATILRFFIPEFITAFLLYSAPLWLDAYFVSQLQSTATYATLGASNNLIHFITKIAEAFSISAIVLSGQHNGRGEYEEAGRAARDVIGVTGVLGFLTAFALYVGAPYIYEWHGVAPEIIEQGVPFLRLRAISVLFMFLYFAVVGFLRGIKNTRVPMKIFVAGLLVFMVLDYGLIFGKLGMPKMGLQGSALASVIQYGGMVLVALGYIFLHPKNERYRTKMLSGVFSLDYARRVFHLSWPVAIDKALMAGAYVWLLKMICPMGTCGIATYSVVKDMERFAFLPAAAFAHVITLLASNSHGRSDWDGIKHNIRRITILASGMVFVLLTLFSLWPKQVIQIFDPKGDFTDLAAQVFPLLSVLVFFDLLQLILSGALRGTGNVKTVMMVRLAVCLGYFVPVSYLIAQSSIENHALKFFLIYGSFYIGNALMSLVYIRTFRRGTWKNVSI